MSDHPNVPDVIDRRSALKKAVVAGGIVWSAPLITSQVANAAGFCTPKCAPTSNTLTGTTALYCTSTGDKWAVITFRANGTCPCGGSPVVCIDPPSTWAKGGAQAFASSVCPGDPRLTLPIAPNQIVVSKDNTNGALGNGTYTSQAVRVAIGCRDRDGDYLWSVCSYSVSFAFQPANGPCSQGTNVGGATATPIDGSCTTACTTGPGCPIAYTC